MTFVMCGNTVWHSTRSPMKTNSLVTCTGVRSTQHCFFNGSNGEPLKEQLKALYIKQEFSRFAVANQGRGAEDVKFAWREFIERVQLDNMKTPSWTPGQSSVQPPGVQPL